MTRLDKKIESCRCQVCRSDLAYLLPCLLSSEAGDGPVGVSQPVAEERPPMVQIFPIPLMIG